MIDINNVNIQKLKLADLIQDAVERENEEAIKWLRTEATKKITRRNRNGEMIDQWQPVNMFRMEYLTKFCGYTKKTRAKMTAEERREKMLDALFDDALNKLTE